MIIGEIARLVITYTGINASTAQTVHWYELQSQNEDDEDVLDRLETWANDDWAAVWDDLASSNAVCESGSVDIVNPDGTVDRNLGDFTINKTGTGSVDQLPAGVAGLLVTPTSVPKVRGRKFIPFWTEGDIAAGQWNGAAVTKLNNLSASYFVDLGGMTGGGLHSGVLSRSLQQFVEFLPTGVVDSVPAYQRRRKPGIGS